MPALIDISPIEAADTLLPAYADAVMPFTYR